MKKRGFIAAVFTLAAVFMLPELLLLSQQATHSWLCVLGAALVLSVEIKMFSISDRRLRRYSLGFGFAFAFFQLAGWRLDAADTLGGLGPAMLLLFSSIALAPACGYGFVLAQRALTKVRSVAVGAMSEKKVFWISFALTMLGWTPVFLAYYPGMFNYDASRQIHQLVINYYDATLPLLHSVILGAFYTLGGMLGSYNTGLALYSFVQCAVVAAAMAYAASYFRKLRLPAWTWIGMTLINALLPTHSLMVMSTTKDLFFCAALLVLLIRLHVLWKAPEKWRSFTQWCIIAILTAAMCLMRNNGAFAIAAACFAALLFLWKNRAVLIRALTALMAGVVLMAAVTAGLNSIYQPPRAGIREWLSLPLSQVARVHAKAVEEGRVLAEEEEIIKFIPDVDRYQRHLSDGIKRHTTLGVVNMPEFLSLWGRLFVQYPAEFFDAPLYLTKGYWHLDDQTHLDIYAERGDHGYMETKATDGYGITRESVLPGLMNKLDELFVEDEYLKIPLLSTIVEPAFWCWLVCLVTLLGFYQRQHGTLLCASLLAGLFVSMLFGPCSYIRYAYPLAICALPLFGIYAAEQSR